MAFTWSTNGVQVMGMLEGVELGQFIIKTQMGRLFRGTYNGEPVTVKVETHSLLCSCCTSQTWTTQKCCMCLHCMIVHA